MKKNKKIIKNKYFKQIILAIFLTYSSQLLSESLDMDLLEAYSLAKTRDPIFNAEFYRYGASAELVAQSKAALNPQISSTSTIVESSDSSLDSASSSLSVSQTLYNQSLKLEYEQSLQKKKQAKLQLAVAEEELMLRLAKAYFAVLSANDNFELSQRNKKAIEHQLQLSNQRLEVGLGTRTDLLDSKARFELSIADLLEAEQLLGDAQHALAEVIGPYNRPLKTLANNIKLALPLPDKDEYWIDQALAHNQSLKIKSIDILLASLEINKKKALKQPNLGLELSGNYYDNPTQDGSRAKITFSMNFPLYQGGLVSSMTRAATKTKYAVMEEYDAKYNSTKKNARQVFLGIKNRIKRISALNEAIKASDNALKAKEEGFKAGLSTNIEILNAQRDLFEAERNYLSERYNFILNLLELEQLIGNLDEDDLRRVNAWLESKM